MQYDTLLSQHFHFIFRSFFFCIETILILFLCVSEVLLLFKRDFIKCPRPWRDQTWDVWFWQPIIISFLERKNSRPNWILVSEFPSEFGVHLLTWAGYLLPIDWLPTGLACSMQPSLYILSVVDRLLWKSCYLLSPFLPISYLYIVVAVVVLVLFTTSSHNNKMAEIIIIIIIFFFSLSLSSSSSSLCNFIG